MSNKLRHVSLTPATHWLREHGVEYSEHVYDYVDHGGAARAAQQLELPLAQIVKTLILQTADGSLLVVLMHGDREVSTRQLARAIGAKGIEPCAPAVAQRHSGYLVGGTSPFGLRKPLPIYVQRTVLDLPRVYINGGRRGYLVGIDAAVLLQPLGAVPVDCAAA